MINKVIFISFLVSFSVGGSAVVADPMDLKRDSIVSESEALESESLSSNSTPFEIPEKLLLTSNDVASEVSPIKKENFNFSGKVTFNPYIVKRQDKNDNVFDAKMYGKVNWKFSDNLSIYCEGLLLGRHGSIQSLWPREYKKEGFNLLELFLKYNYKSYLEIQFGSLRQDFLSAPLLMTDETFPAFREIFSFSLPQDVTGQLLFQQAIPDSMDDDIQYFSQLTQTPFFFTGSVFLEAKSHPKLFHSNVEEKLTFFYFTTLPPAIAKEGERNGNSVLGHGSDAGFNFPFYGIHNNMNWQFPFKDSWVVELGWDYLHNFGAVENYNKGGRFYAALYHDFFNLMELKVMGEVFGNQSDASVASYNSWKYGHNNRQGAGVGLQGYFYQSGLTVGAHYIYTHPIETLRTSLDEGHYFSIYIETGYISI